MMLHRYLKASRSRHLWTATMPKFISNFDKDCTQFVESIIDPSNLHLRKSDDEYNMGLYATNDISAGDLILQEIPLLSTAPHFVHNADPRALLVQSPCPPEWKEDFYLVASAVLSAMKSNDWLVAPSSYLPFRCLGYTQLETPDNLIVQGNMFQSITKTFSLEDAPMAVWSPAECQI